MEDSELQGRKRRFFSWGTLRRMVIVLAWGATIVALLYGIEDWRCRRAWEKYQAEAEARGEHLDLDYYIPKPIPDDRNFAKAGSLGRTLFNPDPAQYLAGHDMFRWHDNFGVAARYVKGPRPFIDAGFHWCDLAAWEMGLGTASATKAKWGRYDEDHAFKTDIQGVTDPDLASNAAAAPGVLRLMDDSGPILDELEAASGRPDARYPLDWHTANPATMILAHYSQIQVAVAHLRLRATAELALGKSDEALKDVELIHYLSDTVEYEPIPIGGLIRIRLQALECQVIWEGLSLHCWTAGQLREMQDRLLTRDFVTEGQRDFAAERAGMLKSVEYYASVRSYNEAASSVLGNAAMKDLGRLDVLARLAPRGWFYLEELSICKSYEANLRPAFDPQTRRVFPSRAAGTPASEVRPEDVIRSFLLHRLLDWYFNGTPSAVSTFAGGQCMADEGAIACGLERYRLAKGAYPTALDGLAPTYISKLPSDPLTGEEYKYRRDSAEKYTLYSVGWDLKDDGGTQSAKLFGESGDWVW